MRILLAFLLAIHSLVVIASTGDSANQSDHCKAILLAAMTHPERTVAGVDLTGRSFELQVLRESLGILRYQSLPGPFSFGGALFDTDPISVFGSVGDKAVDVGILKTPNHLTLWDLPSPLRERLYQWLAEGRNSRTSFPSSFTTAAFLLGLSPWAAHFTVDAFHLDRKIFEYSLLEPGRLVAVLSDSSPHLLAISLGSGLLLAIRPDGGSAYLTTIGLLAQAFPNESIHELITPETFTQHFASDTDGRGSSYLVTRPPLTWEQYDYLFMENFRRSLRVVLQSGETLGVLYHRMQKAGHPDFEVDTEIGLNYRSDGTIPDEVTLKEIDRRIRLLNRRRKLNRSQSFLIARAFYDLSGKDRYVTYGGRIDPSWIEYDLDRIPDRVLGTMIEKGFAPASTKRAVHDWKHFTGLGMSKGMFGARLRQNVQRMNAPESKFTITDRKSRVVYLWEALALVPERNRIALSQLLHPKFSDQAPQLWRVEQVRQWLEGMDFYHELLPHARKLVDEYAFLISGYGGAARDYGTSFYTSSQPARQMAPGLASRLDLMMKKIQGVATREFVDVFDPHIVMFHRGDRVAALVHELARFETLLWNSTFLTPEDIMTDFEKDALSPESITYRFFIESGVLDWTDGVANFENNLHSALRTAAGRAAQ